MKSVKVSKKRKYQSGMPEKEYLCISVCVTLGIVFSLIFWPENRVMAFCSVPVMLLSIFMTVEYAVSRPGMNGRINRLAYILIPLMMAVSFILLHNFFPALLFPIQSIWALMFLIYNGFRFKRRKLSAVIAAITIVAFVHASVYNANTVLLSVYFFITAGIVILFFFQNSMLTDSDLVDMRKVSYVASNFVNELESMQREIIFKLGDIAESRSQETGNHVRRVAEYNTIIAKAYGLDNKDVELLSIVSPIHDIGKLGIPEKILMKKGPLTGDERRLMQKHTDIGYDMLKNSSRELFGKAAVVAWQHHEKYDGSGYPRKKKGEEIHIFGRITALTDVFDALSSDRCYKEAWDLDSVLNFINNEKGKHFDPLVVDCFMKELSSILDIRDSCRDIYAFPSPLAEN